MMIEGRWKVVSLHKEAHYPWSLTTKPRNTDSMEENGLGNIQSTQVITQTLLD